MRLAIAIACIGFGSALALAQVEAPGKTGEPGVSKHSTGRSISPESKGVEQPQGPTGPIDTKSGGAPAKSPQGQTPPGMQSAPDGSSKTVVDPGASKNEPSQSKAADKGPSETATPSADRIFQNGVLTVPGTDPDNQAAPAKYSRRTDASDQLPIAAYALKHLSNEQRSRILTGLRRDMAMTGSADVEPVIGAEVPTMPQGLQQLPDEIVKDLPELRGLAVVRGGDKILLISPTMQRVLAILEQ